MRWLSFHSFITTWDVRPTETSKTYNEQTLLFHAADPQKWCFYKWCSAKTMFWHLSKKHETSDLYLHFPSPSSSSSSVLQRHKCDPANVVRWSHACPPRPPQHCADKHKKVQSSAASGTQSQTELKDSAFWRKFLLLHNIQQLQPDPPRESRGQWQRITGTHFTFLEMFF